MLWSRRWPWVGQQTWNEVVFMHWPVCVHELRPYVPMPLKIDQYDGHAWISIVFFQAKDSRARSFSPSLAYRSFNQLNVRTYVKFGREPGVYFFNLYTNSPLIAKGGQILKLPFVLAEMDLVKENDKRLFSFKHSDDSAMIVKYTPNDRPLIATRGSIAHWLTERYCIWTVNSKHIVKAPISHLPWVLYDVDVNVSGLNNDKATNPLAHYAKKMTAYAHPFERFGIYLRED